MLTSCQGRAGLELQDTGSGTGKSVRRHIVLGQSRAGQGQSRAACKLPSRVKSNAKPKPGATNCEKCAKKEAREGAQGEASAAWPTHTHTHTVQLVGSSKSVWGEGRGSKLTGYGHDMLA